MNKGGYQILDLKNTNFALGTGVKVPGTFTTILGTRKPILVSGIVIAGTEYHDTYVDFTKIKNGIAVSLEGTIYGKKIKIENTDTVTISENA